MSFLSDPFSLRQLVQGLILLNHQLTEAVMNVEFNSSSPPQNTEHQADSNVARPTVERSKKHSILIYDERERNRILLGRQAKRQAGNIEFVRTPQALFDQLKSAAFDVLMVVQTADHESLIHEVKDLYPSVDVQVVEW